MTQGVLATRDAALISYARHWFDLVGQELLAEVADGVGRPPMHAVEYSLSFIRASEANPRISHISVSEPGGVKGQLAGGEGEQDGEDPPLSYQAGYPPHRSHLWPHQHTCQSHSRDNHGAVGAWVRLAALRNATLQAAAGCRHSMAGSMPRQSDRRSLQPPDQPVCGLLN